MARITITYSISLPPEMAAELEEIRKKEHRTRSELLREALRRYVTAAAQSAANDERLSF
jgi:metal-responsive CopG/Arc/MetJ family transcriptional regulator